MCIRDRVIDFGQLAASGAQGAIFGHFAPAVRVTETIVGDGLMLANLYLISLAPYALLPDRDPSAGDPLDMGADIISAFAGPTTDAAIEAVAAFLGAFIDGAIADETE